MFHINEKKIQLLVTIGIFTLCFSLFSQQQVTFETTMGNFVLELDSAKAPITVENFLLYVNDGFYDSLIFHRTVRNFMIQAGYCNAAIIPRTPSRPAITNESPNGLKNLTGTIAMARRSNDPHSAKASFFINTADNTSSAAVYGSLDFVDTSSWGFCVFGKIIDGIDIVHNIEYVRTKVYAFFKNLPVVPVIITRAYESTTRIKKELQISQQCENVQIHKIGANNYKIIQTGNCASLKLFDLKGKQVMNHGNLKNVNNVISLANFANGTYIYEIRVDGKLALNGMFVKE